MAIVKVDEKNHPVLLHAGFTLKKCEDDDGLISIWVFLEVTLCNRQLYCFSEIVIIAFELHSFILFWYIDFYFEVHFILKYNLRIRALK